MEKLIDQFLEKNRTNSVIVIGDICLDEYKYGKVNRISPEFPVVVLKSEEPDGKFVPGMASNVCHQLSHLNLNSILLGFLDQNTKQKLGIHDFNIDFCLELPNGNNPVKVRFYDDNFPLLRWDIEKDNYGEKVEIISELRDKLFSNFCAILDNQKIDAVILSDYNKGLWSDELAQNIIKKCNDKRITTIVDPKAKPLLRWKNCSYFKPNMNEAKLLTNEEDSETQCKKIIEELDCDGVIITQEGRGIIGLSKKEGWIKYSAKTPLNSEDVNSKIGAGDSFLAALTLRLINLNNFKNSCILAFHCGMKYVLNKHNKPISLLEVEMDSISENQEVISSKIVSNLETFSKRNFNLVIVNGCFDYGLTAAHVRLFAFAKSRGDKLCVAINDDDSMKRIKRNPEMPLIERMEVVASNEHVDFVVCFKEDTPFELFEIICPSLIIKGGDYELKDVVGYGKFPVEIFPWVAVTSTTQKIENSTKNQESKL